MLFKGDDSMKKEVNHNLDSLELELNEIKKVISAREQLFQKLESETKKAIEIIREVKPERFTAALKKQDMVITSLKSYIEGVKGVQNSILEEIKSIKARLDVFKDTEKLIEINTKIGERLKDLEKYGHLIAQEKIPQPLTKPEQSQDFQVEIKEDIKKFNAILASLLNDIEKIKTKINTLPTYKHISSINEKIERHKTQFSKIDTKIKELASKNELKKIKEKLKSSTTNRAKRKKPIYKSTKKKILVNQNKKNKARNVLKKTVLHKQNKKSKTKRKSIILKKSKKKKNVTRGLKRIFFG